MSTYLAILSIMMKWPAVLKKQNISKINIKKRLLHIYYVTLPCILISCGKIK